VRPLSGNTPSLRGVDSFYDWSGKGVLGSCSSNAFRKNGNFMSGADLQRHFLL
jgi:hypothetical protein